jgi:hypothetical protein
LVAWWIFNRFVLAPRGHGSVFGPSRLFGSFVLLLGAFTLPPLKDDKKFFSWVIQDKWWLRCVMWVPPSWILLAHLMLIALGSALSIYGVLLWVIA